MVQWPGYRELMSEEKTLSSILVKEIFGRPAILDRCDDRQKALASPVLALPLFAANAIPRTYNVAHWPNPTVAV